MEPDDLITCLLGFRGMVKFVSAYPSWGEPSLLGVLGDIDLFDDGEPFDPAAWDDWRECIEQVSSERISADALSDVNSAGAGVPVAEVLLPEDVLLSSIAFKAMIDFLWQFGRVHGFELSETVAALAEGASEGSFSDLWPDWLVSINYVLAGKPPRSGVKRAPKY